MRARDRIAAWRERTISRNALETLLVCILTALALLIFSPTEAFAENHPDQTGKRVVRVACYEDGTYMSKSQDGTRKGFNIDYLRAISLYANWKYEFVDYPGWESALNALKAGEVDILPMVYQTPERLETMRFSHSSLCETFETVNVRADETRFAYEDFESFEGMRVGVVSDSYDATTFLEYCNEKGFTANIVPYESTVDLTSALDHGELDAVAATYLGSESRFRIVAQFAPRPLYVAFPLDRIEIADEFDLALESLKLRDPGLISMLYDRYLSFNPEQDPVFTQPEYRYLDSAPALRVAYDARNAPFSYTDPETGTFAGVASKLFSDITRITGLQFKYIAVNGPEEAFRLIESGQADIVYGTERGSDLAQSNLVTTTGPYLRDPVVSIVGSNPSGTRIALPEGFAFADRIAQSKESSRIVYCATPKDCMDAVHSGTADAAYIDAHVAHYLLSEPQYESLTMTTITEFSNNLSIAVRNDADPRLQSILDRCVQYTSNRTMDAWISQSSLAIPPTSPLDFLRQYPLQIIFALALLFAAILGAGVYLARAKLRTARQIQRMSFTDPLTGGWSLARFRTVLNERLENAPDETYALAYLDIKRFKSFNAAFGYAAGDELLKGLARTIERMLHEDEYLARITADEFAILLKWEGWKPMLDRFNELDERFNNLPVLKDLSHRLSLIAGLCVVRRSPDSSSIRSQDVIELIDCARYARESIDETAHSAAALYTSDMKERDLAERALVAAAQDALNNGEFTAYYQPKVSMRTNRIRGFEALARWESPERGLVSPSEFIPLFERNGLIIELDLRLFELACRRIRACLDVDGRAPIIACNFSRRHLENDRFPDTLKEIAERHRAPIANLELELTENIVMADLERTTSVCERLKELGFRISIDDFGNGYSSLGTLKDLPIDVLKLDRSFLMSSQSEDRSKAILKGVVNIAALLNVRIVAEGVETKEQADMLMALDPHMVAQGFLYSRPVPLPESDAQFRAGALMPKEAI